MLLAQVPEKINIVRDELLSNDIKYNTMPITPIVMINFFDFLTSHLDFDYDNIYVEKDNIFEIYSGFSFIKRLLEEDTKGL
jgi:hypothetical protein